MLSLVAAVNATATCDQVGLAGRPSQRQVKESGPAGGMTITARAPSAALTRDFLARSLQAA